MAIKLPNDLSKLSAEDINELLSTGQSEFDSLLAATDPTDTDVAEAERLHPLLSQLRDEVTRRETSRQELAGRMEALRLQTAPAPTDPEPEGDPAPAPEAAPAVAAAVATADAPVEAAITIHREDLAQGADESDFAFAQRAARYPQRTVIEAEPVALSAETGLHAEGPDGNLHPVATNGTQAAVSTIAPTVASVARRIGRPEVPARAQGAVTITASADVPDFATGSRMEDMTTVAQGVLNRMKGFPAFMPGAAPAGTPWNMYGVATFRKPFDAALVASSEMSGEEAIQYAKSESRLPGGALTAAGGWCAPSEVLYDLCGGETLDGLLSIPEIQVTRGGIKYTSGIDFSDIYAGVGFCVTEAQAIAGTPDKTCYTVPCPTWQEVRLDACGICIKVPLLTEAGYPELVARVISGAMIAHQHKINAKVIASIGAALGAAVAATDMLGTAQSTWNAVELAIEAVRAKYRLGYSTTMEVVAPHWLLGALRADLSARNGVDLKAISDSEIMAGFAVRHASVQFVEDYQPVAAAGGGCPVVYPKTVELMIYPAGAFVKGVSDIITLNAVYDAASLVKNEYTGLFFEEGILVAKTCYSGCKITIPVCASGASGLPVQLPCDASATAEFEAAEAFGGAVESDDESAE